LVEKPENSSVDGRIILKQVFKNTMACYGWMNIVQDKGQWWAVVGIS